MDPHENEHTDDSAIKAQLLAATPPLRPELRSRILQQCHDRQRQKPRPWSLLHFGHFRFAAAGAGLLLLHWLVVGAIDGNSRSMLQAGAAPAGAAAERTHTAARGGQGADAARPQELERLVRLRSRTLVALLQDDIVSTRQP